MHKIQIVVITIVCLKRKNEMSEGEKTVRSEDCVICSNCNRDLEIGECYFVYEDRVWCLDCCGSEE
jgi:hypothetical protein